MLSGRSASISRLDEVDSGVQTPSVRFGGPPEGLCSLMVQSSPQLRGASRHTLDDKFRLIIPKRLAGVCGGDGAILHLTAHEDGCVLMFDQAGFDDMAERVLGQDPREGLLEAEPRKRDLARLFLGYAEEVRPDKSGRVLIPESLRLFLRLDESGRELFAIGAGDHVQLWSVSRWQARVRDLVKSSLSEEESSKGAA